MVPAKVGGKLRMWRFGDGPRDALDPRPGACSTRSTARGRARREGPSSTPMQDLLAHDSRDPRARRHRAVPVGRRLPRDGLPRRRAAAAQRARLPGPAGLRLLRVRGSLAAGVLALAWPDLRFDAATGQAANFEGAWCVPSGTWPVARSTGPRCSEGS